MRLLKKKLVHCALFIGNAELFEVRRAFYISAVTLRVEMAQLWCNCQQCY